MAAIVGIHGIGQQFKGRYSLQSVWFNAVRDGLVSAGHEARAEKLSDSDLRVAFFGDLFRPGGSMGPGYPYSAADLRPGLETDLLAELYQAAMEREQGPRPGPSRDMGPGRVPAQIMVERLLRTKTFAGLAQHAFVGALKQVAEFLSTGATKDRILERVHASVEDDTRILVGHSMGSIVAYEYLCRYKPPGVGTLITLGSPLGIRNLIFDRLTPTPVNGRGIWPKHIRSWANVADQNDIVALRKEISGLWADPDTGRLVIDREARNGDEPHSAERYLNSPQAGAVLAGVLG